MKTFYSLLFCFSFSVISSGILNGQTLISTCPNSNFNLGTFTNWTGTYGTFANPALYSGLDTNTNAPYPHGNFQCYNGTQKANCPPLHSIITGPGTWDPNTGDSLISVFPGEAYGAQLGHNVGGSHAATLKYTVYVDNSTYLFIYRYAVVLQNPNHTPQDQPSFTVAVEDSLGHIFDSTCGYYYIASPPYPGLLPPTWHRHSNNTINWKEWTTVGMSLTSHVGHHVSIVFTTRDCEPGGHFGYAYVSAYCSYLTIQTSMCQGDSSATLTAPPGFAHYLWSNGDTVRQIVVPHPTTGDTLSCILTAVNSCVDTIHVTLTYTVIVTNFTYGTGCVGQPMQFNDSSYVNQNAVTGWKWNFGDGTPIVSGNANPTHIYTMPGTYNVQLISNSTEGCKDSITKTVTVNTPPVPSLTGSAAVCKNSSSTYTTDAGYSNYTWTVSAGGTITGGGGTNAATILWSTTGAKTVHVNYMLPNGCYATTPTALIVTVNPLPTATISGTTTVCQNAASPLITFTGASSTAPYTFTYKINGGANQFVTTTSGNSVTVPAPTNVTGIFTYTLISVQDGSSTQCSQLQSGTAVITVNPLPTAIISGTIAVCQNAASPLITFTGASSTPPYTFTYNINGGGNQIVTTTSGNSVTVSAPTNVVGIFTYNLISVQDGSSTHCSQSQTGSAVITVNPLPTATIAGTTAVCQNAASPLITFTGASSTPPYTFTYNINWGAIQIVTTTVGDSITVTAPTNMVGTFTYNLISVQDGSTTACLQSQTGSAIITVNPLPTATISGTTAVCQNAASPLITFTGATSTPPYTFTYNINGGSNQNVTTTSGNSVTVSAPTNTVGSFTYNLISVQDGSATSCSQLQTGSAVITVNPLPTATIDGTTAVCQNAVSPLVTFIGASSTPPYTFTYNINGGANQNVSTVAGNSVTVAAPTNIVGSYTYNLISVQDGSSTSCSQLQSGSAVITVNPLPTATISGTTAVCQNAASPLITFTGASSTPPYTFTYNINGGANQNVTTIAGNSVMVSAPTNVVGLFTYNLISVQDGSSTACSQLQSGSATITVNPLPTATISGTTAVCQNAVSPLITFTGASSTPPYSFTYKINGGANQIVTTTSGNSVTVVAPTNVVGIFTYTLISVQDGSSTACSQLQSGSAVITVNPLPTATISGTTAVCQNAASPLITFTGASTIAPYTFTYNINGGANQIVTTISGNSVTVAAPTNLVGIFTYNLISVQDGSATTCSQLQSGSAVITVNPLPTATISGTTAVCQNAASPLITFTGASSTPPYTFTYNINGGANLIVTTVVGNSLTVPVPTNIVGTFTYNLISVQDGSSTACSQLQSGSAVITVNPLPTATISGTTAVCQNAASPLITFTGASTIAPYTFTYNINGGANQIVTTTFGNSVTVAAPTNVVGIFTYNLISVQDGSSTACSQLQSGSAVITVNPLPTATISGTTAVCRNAASPLVTFTGASSTPPYTFTYNINGGANQNVTTIVGNSVTIAAPTNVVGTFTYNLISVQDGSATACSQLQSGSAVITVNPLPTATISGTTAVCQNAASPLITFTGASSTPPYTFTYNINGGGNQNVTTIVGNSVTVAAPTTIVGVFTYNLISVQDGSSTACSQLQSGSAVVTVNALPTATISGTTAVCQNASAPLITFTGASTIAPYTFTYNINGGGNQNVTTVVGNSVTVAAPTNIVGSFTYNLISVQDGSSTACSQLQSGSAVITVNPLPTATISGTTSVCKNAASPLITFTGASSTPPYTFTYKINGGANQNVTTIVGNSVTVAAPTNIVGLFTYTLISVQDGSSTACAQPQSGSAVITVNPLPTATISGTTAVCQNAASPLITFTGASTIAPYTFTYNINGGANQLVTTIVGNSVTVPAPTNIVGSFTYNLISVQDGSPTACVQFQSGSATVTVNPLPTATISGTIAVCQNSPSPLITFTGGSSTAPYTFTYNINGGANQNVSTIVGNSVTVSAPTNVVGIFNYNLISVQDASSTLCSQLQSGIATVTINSLPVPSISGATAVCLNSTSTYLTDAGMSNYSWTVSAGGTITSGTGTNSITVLWISIGSKTIQVNYINGNGCTAASPSSYSVTVSSLPDPSLTGINSICSGLSAIYTTDPGMTTYSWSVSAGGSIIAGGGTTDNTVTVLWNTAGAQTVSVNYLMGPGCTAPSPTVYDVTVKPRPSITNAANSTMCSNGTTNIVPIANLPGTTFSWTATGSSGNVSGYSNGSGSSIIQTLVNTGFNIETVTYTVTPNLNGCDGAIANYVVTVNPVADVYFNPNGQSFCSGGTTSISILSHVSGTTFTWTATGSSGNVSGFGPGSGNLIAQTLTNSGPYFENVNYDVFPIANSCAGTDNHVIVNMNPTPQVSFTICNDIVTTTDAKPITLKGGVPLGGVYSGTGVNAGIFYPSLAGPGNFTINYSYTNTWGCSANKSLTISVISAILFNCDNTLTDIRDNQTYPTVKIGTQCWMAANLNYGTIIPSTSMQRDNCIAEKYCYGDNVTTCATYGGLYQWDELMQYDNTPEDQGFCPPAWHIPTNNDWNTLYAFYISNGFAGSPLKYTGYSGFNAFLSGMRFNNVSWNFSNFAVMFWTSSPEGTQKAWAHGMNTINPSVSNYPGSRNHAFNVRCIKD